MSLLSSITQVLNPLTEWELKHKAYKNNEKQAKDAQKELQKQLKFVESELAQEYNSKIGELQKQQQYVVNKSRLTQQTIDQDTYYKLSQNALQRSNLQNQQINDLISNEVNKQYKLSQYSNQLKYLSYKAHNLSKEYGDRLYQLRADTESMLNKLNIQHRYTINNIFNSKEVINYNNKINEAKNKMALVDIESKLKSMYGASGVSLVGSPMAAATAIANKYNQQIEESAALSALKESSLNNDLQYENAMYSNNVNSVLTKQQSESDLLKDQYGSQLMSIKQSQIQDLNNMQYEENRYNINVSNIDNQYAIRLSMLDNSDIFTKTMSDTKSKELKTNYLYNYNNLNTQMDNLYTNFTNAVKTQNADYNSRMWGYAIKQSVWNQANMDNNFQTVASLTKLL